MTNSTALTTSKPEKVMETSPVAWATIYAVVALAVTVGNALTILIFCKNRKLLRTRTNYFLVSLSVADLLIGACLTPMFVLDMLTYYWIGSDWPLSTFHSVYLPFDVFMSFASIFAVVMIALERACSIYAPHRHRAAKKKTYLLLVALLWALAGSLGCLRLVGFLFKTKLFVDIFSYCMIASISGSLLIISLAYALVWWRVRNPLHLQHKDRATPQERKLAVTLSILTVVFVCTWVPFYIMNIVILYCKSCYVLEVVYFGKLLHYSNSFMNPIIYTFKIREYRKTLVNLLCAKKSKVRRHKKKNTEDSIALHRVEKRVGLDEEKAKEPGDDVFHEDPVYVH